MLGREWHRDEGGSSIGRPDVAARSINVDADEIDWSTDRVHILGGDLRGVRTGSRQEGLAVAAFHDRGQVGRVELARGELGRRDMLGRLDDWHADADVLRRPGLRARTRAGADTPVVWPSSTNVAHSLSVKKCLARSLSFSAT